MAITEITKMTSYYLGTQLMPFYKNSYFNFITKKVASDFAERKSALAMVQQRVNFSTRIYFVQ